MRKRFLCCALLLSVWLSLAGCGKTYDTDVYRTTVAALADDEAWEFVDIGATYPVMLVSSELIADGKTNSMSAGCDVYYVVDNQAVSIGRIEGAGTAYPLRADDTGIYAASEEDIWRYEINDKLGILELAQQGSELKESYEEAEPVLFGYGASGR